MGAEKKRREGLLSTKHDPLAFQLECLLPWRGARDAVSVHKHERAAAHQDHETTRCRVRPEQETLPHQVLCCDVRSDVMRLGGMSRARSDVMFLVGLPGSNRSCSGTCDVIKEGMK